MADPLQRLVRHFTKVNLTHPLRKAMLDLPFFRSLPVLGDASIRLLLIQWTINRNNQAEHPEHDHP